ncbi:MAG: hypothetical protein LBJ94_00950 [Puniceicoccales bacterium]|jgi:hypothetical protein|nr:hypothetical protein [Puniceicoccales bacterium]
MSLSLIPTSASSPYLLQLAAAHRPECQSNWPQSPSCPNLCGANGENFTYATKEELDRFVSCLPDISHTTQGKIFSMFVKDCNGMAAILGTLEKSQRQVNGAFVCDIDIFSDPSTQAPLLVRKPIAKVSQLPRSSRGFHAGGPYGFVGPRLNFGLPSLKESRPILNLFMLRFLMQSLEKAAYPACLCKFFAEPKIVLDGESTAFQVMEHLDISVKIFNQTLPRDGAILAKLVVNLCEAACLANVAFQSDCCPGNLCFLRDAQGDICDIRMFDCDIMSFGEEEDRSELLDFTNLMSFDIKNSCFQKGTGAGYFDMRAALPPLISRNLYDALSKSMGELGAIAFDFSSDKSFGVPPMLRAGGLLEQWLGRVMIVGDDGRLYKNASSEESTEFDGAAALFVLCKLGCSNREQTLFSHLSFLDLEARYADACLPLREAELMEFFRHFCIEKWAAMSPYKSHIPAPSIPKTYPMVSP